MHSLLRHVADGSVSCMMQHVARPWTIANSMYAAGRVKGSVPFMSWNMTSYIKLQLNKVLYCITVYITCIYKQRPTCMWIKGWPLLLDWMGDLVASEEVFGVGLAAEHALRRHSAHLKQQLGATASSSMAPGMSSGTGKVGMGSCCSSKGGVPSRLLAAVCDGWGWLTPAPGRTASSDAG